MASINEHVKVTIFSLYYSMQFFLLLLLRRAANELQKLHNFHEMGKKWM